MCARSRMTATLDATRNSRSTEVGGRRASAAAHGLRKMPALDGLRGLAIAGVLLYHGGHLTGGWLGVDLFFVLSGYLITSLLLAEWQRRDGIDLLAFWGRRARRLFPALLLLICGVAVYALFIASPFDLGQVRSDGLFTVFYAANWHAVTSSQDYFQISLAPSPFQHTWSLAIEEQFYLVWPVLLLLVLRWRRSVAAVFVLAAGLAAASVGWMIALHAMGASPSRLYYATDTRASSVLFGASLAALQHWRGEGSASGPRWVTTQVAGLYGLAGLLIIWFTLEGQSSFVYEGGLALCGLLAALVIAAASNSRSGVLGWLLSWKPLRGLGLISYGVYLYHWPIFMVLDTARTGLTGWPLFVVQVAATLAAALASYALVEQPIRQRRFLSGGIAALAALPVAAGLAVTVLLTSTVGAQSSDISATSAQNSGIVSGGSGTPVVMIVGDSTAWSLAIAMGVHSKELRVTVANRGIFGCGVLNGAGQVRDWQGDLLFHPPVCIPAWARATHDVRPDLVLLLFGRPPVSQVQLGGVWHHACNPTFDQALQTSLDTGVRALESTGAHVVVMTTPDVASTGVGPSYPAYAQAYVECQNAVLRNVVAASGPHAALLDTNLLLCPQGPSCPPEIDGIPIRTDGLHFRGADGVLVAQWVLRQVRGVRAASQTG